MNQSLLSLALASLFLLENTFASELHQIESDSSNQTSLTVTIYNDSLALINETRLITLKKGINNVRLKDISAQIQSETGQLTALSGEAFQVIEQNFDYDLLTPAAMLNKAIGQSVNIISIDPETDQESTGIAIIRANNNGVILEYDDHIETKLPDNARLSFSVLPDNLHINPTLSIALDQPIKESKAFELSYLTDGSSWKADDVANLSKNESTLDLSGWITLNNQSGSTFKNANESVTLTYTIEQRK